MKDAFGPVLLFMLIYNISFQAVPPLTTGRLAILFLALAALPGLGNRLDTFVREHSRFFAIYVIVLLYAFVAYITAHRVDALQVSRLLNFMVHTMLAAVLYSSWIGKDLPKFYRHMAYATALQSVLQVYSLFSPDYRFWLADILVQGGNNELTFAGRPPGFANATGAAFSIIQALGLFAALRCIEGARGARVAAGFSLLALLNVISTILSGRTGLVMATIFLAHFIIVSQGRSRWIFIGATIFIIGCFFQFGESAMNMLASFDASFTGNFRYITELAFEFFVHGEVASVTDLSTMPIPPLGWDTFIGTGLVVVDGQRVTGNDSGYIQAYYSLGLAMSFVFYLAFLGFNLGIANHTRSRVGFFLLIAVMFAVETKEPFIFKYVQGFFILVAMLLDQKEDVISQGNEEADTETPPVAPRPLPEGVPA